MICLNALDKFATDHLLFQAKCSAARQRAEFSTPPTDAEVAVALIRIRQYVLNGSLDEAIAIVESLCPDAVKDPELQLEIRIHKLFELIHKTQVALEENPQQHRAAVQRALGFSQDLADFALHAFPDAYAKFTQSMMIFAFPAEASSSDKLTKKRDTLAGNLLSLVRMTLGARESCLSFLFRYLLVIYMQARSPLKSNGEDNAVYNDIIGDLLPWKICEDGPAARISWGVDDASFVKSKTLDDFSVAEVQALRERVNITRHQSVQSLRFTNGNTLAALRNELGRLKLNEKLFELLVMDYYTARGLDGFETSTTNQEHMKERFPSVSSHRAISDSSSSVISPSSIKMSVSMRKLRTLARQTDYCDVQNVTSIQELLPETSNNLEFRLSLRQTLYLLHNDYLAESIQYCREKIGPLAHECPELLPLLSDALLLVVYAHDYKRIRRKEDGNVGARSMEICKEGTKLGNTGRDNGETSNDNCSRFEVLLAEAYCRVTQYCSVDSILREAYESLEGKFGEPKLVKLLKKLLAAHEEWQSKNLMKDQFADKLGIHSLRHGLPHDMTDEPKDSSIKDSLRKISTDAADDEAAPVQRYEETILALMEFLAMTRTEALSAVMNHPLANDPQAMVDYVLSSMM